MLRASSSTEANGSFIIAGISEGHFRISAPGLPPQFYIADVRQTVSVFDSGFEIPIFPSRLIEIEQNLQIRIAYGFSIGAPRKHVKPAGLLTLAMLMLAISFVLLLAVGALRRWATRHDR